MRTIFPSSAKKKRKKKKPFCCNIVNCYRNSQKSTRTIYTERWRHHHSLLENEWGVNRKKADFLSPQISSFFFFLLLLLFFCFFCFCRQHQKGTQKLGKKGRPRRFDSTARSQRPQRSQASQRRTTKLRDDVFLIWFDLGAVAPKIASRIVY